MKKQIMMNDDYTQAYATKAFLNKAKYFGSPEWEELRKFKIECPNVKLIPRKSTSKKTSDTHNLTYDNMRKYLGTMENSKELMIKLDTTIIQSKVQKNPYRFVLAWFLKTFEGYTANYEQFFKDLNEKQGKNGADNGTTSTADILPFASNQ